MKNAAKLVLNKLPKLKTNFAKLTSQDVLVGVPQDEAPREDETPGPMNNATIAYIQDNGAPASNIPARPFMIPGIKKAKPGVVAAFKSAAQGALHSEDAAVDKGLHKAGLIAQAAIRSEINEGIPPPLKPSTIANRFRSRGTKSMRKGEKAYFAALSEGKTPAEAQSSAGIKPLVNTGQLRNAINYVLRRKSSGAA